MVLVWYVGRHFYVFPAFDARSMVISSGNTNLRGPWHPTQGVYAPGPIHLSF